MLDIAGRTPHGRWWDATFHTVTAVVGVGVLSLPYAFSYLTWTGGIIALALTTATSLYTAYLLAALHEEKDGRRWAGLMPVGLCNGSACRGPECMFHPRQSALHHADMATEQGKIVSVTKKAACLPHVAQAQPVQGPGPGGVWGAVGQLGHRALPVERAGRPGRHVYSHSRAEPTGDCVSKRALPAPVCTRDVYSQLLRPSHRVQLRTQIARRIWRSLLSACGSSASSCRTGAWMSGVGCSAWAAHASAGGAEQRVQ